jgi:hypothetical protein
MEYSVLLRRKIKVYGDHFHVELREYRPDYFQLVDIYENCEHDRGIPYHTLEDAIRGFEAATGKRLTDELKEYLKES